jgi:hypothetical protein
VGLPRSSRFFRLLFLFLQNKNPFETLILAKHRKKMKIKVFVSGLVLFLAACNSSGKKKQTTPPPATEKTIAKTEIKTFLDFPLDRFKIEKDTVKRNETLAKILMRRHFSPREIYLITSRIDSFFDVKDIRANKPYYLVFPPIPTPFQNPSLSYIPIRLPNSM